MPKTERGGATLFRYLGVIGSVAVAAGFGISHLTIASEILGQRSPEKTVLDQRLENAREIKEAAAHAAVAAGAVGPYHCKACDAKDQHVVA